MDFTNPKWYVIQTKPKSERRVETHLSHQEIETFLPMVESFHSMNGGIIQGVKPLFPNYLFARLDLAIHYYKVKWTRGVAKIVGIGNGPIPLSEKVIQAIKDRMGEDHLIKLDDGLEEGSLVQFVSGPFKELVGVFNRKMSDGKRVRILMNLIGVDVFIQVPRWQIRKVA